MTNNPRLDETLAQLADRLRLHSDTPELDAQVLLAKVLQRPRSWLAAHPETPLDPSSVAALEGLARRLEAGEPLPYLLGEWEFFGLPFYVTPAVLIPRPETELLIERALALMQARRAPCALLDVGTGSGCIAITLALHLPQARVTATDISPAALEVARRNAERHRVSGRVDFLEADLFPVLTAPFPFDLITANLPYIPTATLQRLPIFGREPTLALDGGPDGLALIRRLLTQSPAWLAAGGVMLLEIEASQGAAAVALAKASFPRAAVTLHRDLAGHDRLVEVCNDV